jgi:soluble lytic murein transglycosylase-like protein
MDRRFDPLRVLAGLAALGFCGLAVTGVLRHPAPVLSAPTAAAPVAARERGQWTVSVDGWQLEFDGVAPGALAALDALLPPPPGSTHRAAGFEPLIRRHARAAGLDWRFVWAVVEEESQFEPDAESPAGAVGLMQVRAIAAREVGEPHSRHPDGNIRTGVRYLQCLRGKFGAARGRDHLALVLAAYHMGPGHVYDAQRLAHRFGYDPLRWDGAMEHMLPLLEQSAIYAKLPNGFARGQSTVGYVNRVLDRYAQLRTARAD